MTSEKTGFSPTEVLAVAENHPFYGNAQYPPGTKAIQAMRARAARQTSPPDLKSQPLLWKSRLYKTIERLVDDEDPRNTFRRGVYVSTTGGGSSPRPLFFATNVHENRQQRLAFGRLLGMAGLVTEKDWVVTVHPAGALYRSLDLTLEILENGGASVLAAGQFVPPKTIVDLLIKYRANVLAGDSSQIVNLVHYFSSLPLTERTQLKLDKIIYTSESLTAGQRAQIHGVLGEDLSISSILGSAEAGPYAFGCPKLTGKNQSGGGETYEDLIFDTRLTLIEILPLSVREEDEDQTPAPIPDGQKGAIAQTSLSRLSNPLVRYMTGDLGSLHDLPQQARASVPETEWPHLRILRLYGRDRRLSFEWAGNYYEFSNLSQLMDDPKWQVLQWQVILEPVEENPAEAAIEFRVLSARGADGEALCQRIRDFCDVNSSQERKFRVVFVKDLDGFVRSAGAGKVIKFVDRFS